MYVLNKELNLTRINNTTFSEIQRISLSCRRAGCIRSLRLLPLKVKTSNDRELQHFFFAVQTVLPGVL
jgi:hypothetical protein